MPRRLDKTWTDYVAIGICPVLIMLLVGSLTYFLLLVGYAGDYDQRIRWVMGCFVMAIVLISRISMEDGAEKATVYGVALTGAMALVVMKFIQQPLIAWGVLAIIWWSAHKLTWDCTLIDEQEDAAGEGLLQVVGLDAVESNTGQPASPPEKQTPGDPWWKGLLRPRKKAAVPGVWVVYFSFAALPLYGLGQWFLPADDLDARRAAFFYLVVYVASALGLLLATALLGLRRYLRQRNLTMPLSVTGMWIGSGTALILLVLALCMLIPRPEPEYSVSSLSGRLSSDELESSRHAQLGDSGVQNNDEQGTAGQPPPEQEAQPSDEHPRPQQDQPQPDQSEKSAGEGDQGQQGSGKAEQSGENGKPSKGTSEQGPAAKSRKTSQGQTAGESKQSPQQQQDQQDRQQPPSSSDRASPSPESSSTARPQMPELGTIGRWVLNALIFGAVAFALIRYRRQLLAGFQQLLASWRALFQQLFGKPTTVTAETSEAAAALQPVACFADYPNPFERPIPSVRTPEQAVVYSFRALEAWAAEHGTPRQPQETPGEFADRIGEMHAEVARPLRDLATLFARLNYGNQRLPSSSLSSVRTFWDALELHQAARRI